MADISAATWDETASSNTTPAPDGAPEGMLPSDVNNTMRENMAAIKRWYNAMQSVTTSTGSANAYIVTQGVAPTLLDTGAIYGFLPNFANTGAATVNINSLGAKDIIRDDGSALTTGDILTTGSVYMTYNGTAFVLINPATRIPLPVTLGGTGAITAAAAQTALGLDPSVSTVAFSTTPDWDTADSAQGHQIQLTLTASTATLQNPTNLQDGGFYSLELIQDGTGSWTMLFDTVYKFPNGTAPTLSTAAGAVDILTFYSDGTNMYGMATYQQQLVL